MGIIDTVVEVRKQLLLQNCDVHQEFIIGDVNYW